MQLCPIEQNPVGERGAPIRLQASEHSDCDHDENIYKPIDLVSGPPPLERREMQEARTEYSRGAARNRHRVDTRPLVIDGYPKGTTEIQFVV